jgi:hypothetical protein
VGSQRRRKGIDLKRRNQQITLANGQIGGVPVRPPAVASGLLPLGSGDQGTGGFVGQFDAGGLAETQAVDFSQKRFQGNGKDIVHDEAVAALGDGPAKFQWPPFEVVIAPDDAVPHLGLSQARVTGVAIHNSEF